MSGPERRTGRRPRRGAPPNVGALRVIAGDLGGRRFDSPGGDSTRPTADRVREAIFNSLGSLGAIAEARVLDAFAGSGALGIEALSRGAAEAVFVESDPAARSVVEGNVEALGLGRSATVRAGDGPSVAAASGPWDLILLDPPYAREDWPDLLGRLTRALAPDGIIVVEASTEPEVPGDLHVISRRTYGGTVVMFLTSAGADK